MSVDLASLVLSPSTIGSTIAGLGALGATACGAALLVPPLSRRLLPQPKETRLCDFLPFDHLLSDRKTISTQRGDLVQIVKFAGAELQVTNDNEHFALFSARRTWLNQMAERKTRIRIFSVRTAIKPGQLMPHPNPLMAELSDTWERSHADSAFHTDHYAILSVEKSEGRAAIEESAGLTLSTMAPFRPEILVDGANEGPLKILGRLASPITRPTPKYIPGANVSEQITADTVHFADDHSGLITFHSGTTKRYMAVVGIKTWGDFTEEKMLADMASLSFEYMVYHHIEPLNRAKATAAVDISYRLARTTFLSATAQTQFAEVQELVSGSGEGTQVLCNYGLNILIEANSVEELASRVAQINTIAAQYEVTTVREGPVSQAVWFSQFPTWDKLPRPWKPLAANVATLLAMQRNHKGATSSPWGDSPITTLKTSTGSPFSFVFHDMSDPGNREPLGHMLVIGPSGSGKTVTISWLAMMAMRYPEVRVFFFDRFYGTEVVTRMFGGNYVRFDGEEGSAAMNPLQMDLTPRNKDFLKTWLKLITDLHDDDSAEQFSRAVEMLDDDTVQMSNRNLQQIWSTAFPADSKARSALRPWTSLDQHGSVFCAHKDSLDLSSRMTAFDFTNILNDERKDNLGPAVVSYLMHRTMDVSVQQGHPAIYFVDETAPLLRNDFFAAKFAAGLQEGRKLGQVFICAFQRPNAIEETPHAQTIIGQCATQIFFRNVKAKAEDFAIFGLTPRELDFVLGRSHANLGRAFLLRRMSETDGIESVIIDADMSALGAGLQAFASGNASVRMIRDLQRSHPDDFRRIYLERFRKAA